MQGLSSTLSLEHLCQLIDTWEEDKKIPKDKMIETSVTSYVREALDTLRGAEVNPMVFKYAVVRCLSHLPVEATSFQAIIRINETKKELLFKEKSQCLIEGKTSIFCRIDCHIIKNLKRT